MKVTKFTITQDVNDEIVRLRELLHEHQIALAAVFVASFDGEYMSLIFDDRMAPQHKINMFKDLEESARHMRELFEEKTKTLPN